MKAHLHDTVADEVISVITIQSQNEITALNDKLFENELDLYGAEAAEPSLRWTTDTA